MLSICPVGPIEGGKIIFDSLPAEYREFTPAQGHSITLILSGSAKDSTIEDINETVAVESPEDRPSDEVVGRAKELLNTAQRYAPIYLAASDVECFEGDLHVHWVTAKKRMTIISSRRGQPIRLYKTIAGGLAQVIQNPSAADVTLALQWVLQ